MRISDKRYSRDLRRYSLAMRLIRHEARTQTIIAWSGLSMYRIRTLYRAYGTDRENPSVLRPRGRPPHQLSFFRRSARLASEAATLAGIARLLNVFPANPAHDALEPLKSLQRGEGICGAYELFHAYIPTSEVSIDHAFLLVNALFRGDEVRLGHCVDCDSLILVDCFNPSRQTCAYCSSSMKKAL
jgi:hypothetical protein